MSQTTTDGIRIFSEKVCISYDPANDYPHGRFETLKNVAIRRNLLRIGKEIAETYEDIPIENIISDKGDNIHSVYTKMIVISEKRLAELLLAERTLQQWQQKQIFDAEYNRRGGDE